MSRKMKKTLYRVAAIFWSVVTIAIALAFVAFIVYTFISGLSVVEAILFLIGTTAIGMLCTAFPATFAGISFYSIDRV